MNVTAHLVGCSTQLSYSGYNITETLTKSCCDVIIDHEFLYPVISIFRSFNRGSFYDANSIFLLNLHVHMKLENNASE